MNQPHDTMQKGREGGFLRSASDAGLFLSIVLWAFAQISLITIDAPVSPFGWLIALLRVAVAIVLALCCALVLPALLAMIAPSSPAGMLLQRYRRTTWGFVVLLGAAGFLGWYAYTVVSAFWAASLTNPEFATMQTITTLIFAVVVPALSFSWSSPMAWAAEVQQAHLVKKLELAHQADIAAAKVAYFRAVDLLRVGIANMTALERQEVAGILAAMQRSQNDTLEAIAGTFRTIAGAELAMPTMDDDQLVNRFNDLAKQLERRVLDVTMPEDAPDHVAAHVPELAMVSTPFDPTSIVDSRAATRETFIEGDRAHVDSRLQSSMPREHGSTQHVAASRHSTQSRDPEVPPRPAEYDAARERLGTVNVWTARQLADVLRTAESTARETIADWKRAELLDETRLGRYRFRDTQVVRL
jgi:hypothetical protein